MTPVYVVVGIIAIAAVITIANIMKDDSPTKDDRSRGGHDF